MTDLRQAAQQALEAYESANLDMHIAAIHALRTALKQQAEPVYQWRKRGALLWHDGYPELKDYTEPLESRTLYTTPPQRKPLTDEQPVSNADELPSGFVPLQKRNGRLVYAACMDPQARHYKWLMWRHPDGQWVSKRKLVNWEVMQVENQQHYGIVQKATNGIKEQ